VLIPRPETECWTIRLSEVVSPTPRRPISVLDLCTGSGCIPLLLCYLWPKGCLTACGVDVSPDAVQLAKDNAVVCRIPTEAPATSRLKSNVFIPLLADIRDHSFVNSLRPPFDIVTSNPPYIPRREYELLPPCVKNYEDAGALLGDTEDSEQQDGLSFYHLIARFVSIKGMLKEGGLVVLEVGDRQANAVRDIMRLEAGLRDIEIWQDYWGKDRTVVGRRLDS
jgi:release factor glutamine methyltransferase